MGDRRRRVLRLDVRVHRRRRAGSALRRRPRPGGRVHELRDRDRPGRHGVAGPGRVRDGRGVRHRAGAWSSTEWPWFLGAGRSARSWRWCSASSCAARRCGSVGCRWRSPRSRSASSATRSCSSGTGCAGARAAGIDRRRRSRCSTSTTATTMTVFIVDGHRRRAHRGSCTTSSARRAGARSPPSATASRRPSRRVCRCPRTKLSIFAHRRPRSPGSVACSSPPTTARSPTARSRPRPASRGSPRSCCSASASRRARSSPASRPRRRRTIFTNGFHFAFIAVVPALGRSRRRARPPTSQSRVLRHRRRSSWPASPTAILAITARAEPGAARDKRRAKSEVAVPPAEARDAGRRTRRRSRPCAARAPALRADRRGARAARDVHSGYGLVEVLHGVSLVVAEPATITAILGPNGAGKSTHVPDARRAHSGRRRARSSSNGDDITSPPRASAGDAGRRARTRVARHLPRADRAARTCRCGCPTPAQHEQAYERFPILGERRQTCPRATSRAASSRC